LFRLLEMLVPKNPRLGVSRTEWIYAAVIAEYRSMAAPSNAAGEALAIWVHTLSEQSPEFLDLLERRCREAEQARTVGEAAGDDG
jgi:hypothetical protein